MLSSYLGIDHSVVVYPENTDDVVEIVKIANKYRMPIVPYAGATSLEGQYRGVWHCYTLSYKLDTNPIIIKHLIGSICVDMTNMDQIIAINGIIISISQQALLG